MKKLCPIMEPLATVWGENVIQEAREIILTIMRKGDKNASSRLKAAQLVMSNEFLGALSDEQLLAEVRRRTDLAKGKKEQ